MPARSRYLLATCCSLLALGLYSATAEADGPAFRTVSTPLVEGRSGGTIGAPSQGPHVGSRGGTIIADAHGLLVVERNAGAIVRSDASGQPVASLSLGPQLGEIVHDGAGQVFVADRGRNRVVQLDPGDAAGKGLAERRSVEITEPHGLALTPDGATLLVTSVADQRLAAFDTATLKPRWSVELPPEPRGVSVSSDGTKAAVGFLTAGVVANLDLRKATPSIRWQSLDPRDHVHLETEEEFDFTITRATLSEARSRFQVPTDTGRRQARAAFAVGYIGDDQLVVPHQLATSQLKRRPQEEMQDSYGGGADSISPLVHRLARVTQPGTVGARVEATEVPLHQPRSFAYDLKRDLMVVGGYGDDTLLALGEASGAVPYTSWKIDVSAESSACGIDGVVMRGQTLWAHCELSRNVVRFDLEKLGPGARYSTTMAEVATVGPALAPTLRDELVERGAEIFRRGGDDRLSDGGAMACSNCHPEGRADGLTWRLGKSILQTPILAGRVAGTAPYKWDGQDRNLDDSLHHTIGRLGGFPHRLRGRDFRALRAYILSMNPPVSPSVPDTAAVARGQALFESNELACDACHAGDKLTDGEQYDLGKTRYGATDTPSLVGLAHSSPYYHDGSAPDLRTLLTDRGNIHDMADVDHLSDADVDDLTAYLRTL